MTELEKAALMALEALDEIHAGKRHPQLALAVAHNLRKALTQALATTERKGEPSIPAGWVACRIEHEPGYPEDVAYGPQRMMDRLKKWLDKHFANTSTQMPERKGEPVARVELMKTGGNAGLATRIVEIDDPLRERLRPGDLRYTSPQVPEGLQWFTVAEDGLPDVGEEVIGGHWYTDPWLKPEYATRFMWGLCRVFADDRRDCPDGKRWQTFGPSHNQITHWARINLPAIDAARKGE